MSQVIRFDQAAFITSAPNLQQCPPEEGAEVAFAGRSNAGKSSAINKLTGNGKLARTSKTPGRTQLLNFFSLGDERVRLVDLPGYGYAKVPLAVKQQWQLHLSEYLQHRTTLRGIVLLMDVRHPLQEFDRFMLEWSQKSQLPTHILLTKSDKLKRGPAKTALLQTRKYVADLDNSEAISCQLFSSVTGEGTDILEETLTRWLSAAPDSADEAPAESCD